MIQALTGGAVLAECDGCHRVVHLAGVAPPAAEAATAQRYGWTVWTCGRSIHPRTYCRACTPTPSVARRLRLAPHPLD